MDKLQQLENRCHLLKCDGRPDSMLELVNIVRELIEEIKFIRETKRLGG